MFASISGSLGGDSLDRALAEMRVLLLEASVPAAVAGRLLEGVKARAADKLSKTVSPSRALQKIVYEEVAAILKRAEARLKEIRKSPYKMLLVGLQGAGKTTAAGKLARHLKHKGRKRVLLASADIRRPAAQEQLRILAAQVGVGFVKADKMDEAAIVKQALAAASTDVLLMDSAGCSPSGRDSIAAVKNIHRLFKADEILLVLDAASGQAAAETVRGLRRVLPLHASILTRLDGDAAGGATLAVAAEGIKIKFVSDGERMENFADFNSARLAARILGFEKDALAQLEEILAAPEGGKVGENFDLNAFAEQLERMERGGGLQRVAQLLPNLSSQFGRVPRELQVDEKLVKVQKAVLGSMTAAERADPSIIRASRRRRIAQGAGVRVEDVNMLLKKFHQATLMLRRAHPSGGAVKLPPKKSRGKRRLAFRP